jgi:hypothetical protein
MRELAAVLCWAGIAAGHTRYLMQTIGLRDEDLARAMAEGDLQRALAAERAPLKNTLVARQRAIPTLIREAEARGDLEGARELYLEAWDIARELQPGAGVARRQGGDL